MSFSPQPIHRSQSLYQQTYQALYSAILSGELAPGQRLIETQLATKFQVSRTPIREAIRQLQLKGLVMTDESGGLCVTQVSVEDAMHLYDCRIALEQLAVRGACQFATPEDLQRIEQNLADSDAAVERQGNHPSSPELLELNFEFHRLLAESSGNPWLVSLLEQVSDKITLLRVQTLRTTPNVLNIHTEHRQIYEAIAQRNEAAAIQAITQHLQSSQQRVSDCFENL